MRWFKHMCDSGMDEKLVILQAHHGLEGYGFYWRVLEHIGAKVDETGKNFCEFPLEFWRKSLGITPKTFQKLLKTCEKLGLFSVENTENGLKILSPNILKYRDEWSRKRSKNSGVAPEGHRSKDPDPETDPEIDPDQDLKTPPTPSPGEPDEKKKKRKVSTGDSDQELRQAMAQYTANPALLDALQAFLAMRKRIRKPLTGHAWKLILGKLDKLGGADDTRKIAILEQSIVPGWLDIYELKEPQARASPGRAYTAPAQARQEYNRGQMTAFINGAPE